MELDWNLGALADGLRCYRSQQFFEAHEHWESVWLHSQQPEKLFLQALIQMAGAFHHFKRGNERGATSLLTAALRKLEPYPESFAGVEVATLRAEIVACLQALAAQGTHCQLPFPQLLIRQQR